MRKSVNEIKTILKEYFQKHPEIEVAYVFGSVAQEKDNVLSDIDIGIIIDKGQINEQSYRYGYKAEILTDLIKLLKTNNIDLVILNDANTLLKHRVLYFGKVIYSKNEKNRIQFQVNTINKYADFRQFIKQQENK
ncbi:MAG TPA: nucleotidyltransferase domain-containing protein [Candidatus Ratteibacteria bacterium]|nr:nucleotidyltransferase domain-containing protein [Candidatus Ratteibacteria bacterium]